MRWDANRPLLLGEDLGPDRTPPRHVVATGTGMGISVDLHEELWVQGTEAEALVLRGFFILIDDRNDPPPGARAAAPTVPLGQLVDPAARRRQQIKVSKQTDGTVLMNPALYPAEGRAQVPAAVTVEDLGGASYVDLVAEPGDGEGVVEVDPDSEIPGEVLTFDVDPEGDQLVVDDGEPLGPVGMRPPPAARKGPAKTRKGAA